MVSWLVDDGNDALCETARDFAWQTKVCQPCPRSSRSGCSTKDIRDQIRGDIRRTFAGERTIWRIWRGKSSSKLLRTAGKKKRAHRLARNQKLEQKTRQCDVIKFKLTVFYRAESSEYSYHVEEQAVLVKYSSCVSAT